MSGRALHHALSGIGVLVAIGAMALVLARCAP